jgi:ABC-type uncharacterized transport system substrate-binding protein
MQFHQCLKSTIFVIFLVLAILLPTACQSPTAGSTPVSLTQTPTPNAAYTGKKILVVDSYSVDFEWTAGIDKGIHNVLDKTAIDLKFNRMDTKNHPDTQSKQQAAERAKADFDAFKPDLVIVSDDNAVQYFVKPYLQDSTVPVLFVGVNWNASAYALDSKHITGMLEVDNVDQLVNDLKPYAKGDRLGLVTVDNETERKTVSVYNSDRYFKGALNVYWVKTYADFKSAFLKAQGENDLVLLSNNGGLTEWNDKDAIPFFTSNAKVPTGSTSPSMTLFALVTVAKVPEEQGEWGAQTALSIFDGTPVSSIPVVENKKAKLGVNLDIAKQLGVVFSPSVLRNADIYPVPSGK